MNQRLLLAFALAAAVPAAAAGAPGAWPNCPGLILPGPFPPEGTPCRDLEPRPGPTLREMFPAWASYAEAHSVVPNLSGNCSGQPDGHWTCWTPNEIAKYGACVGTSMGGLVVWGSSIDRYFVHLAGGMDPDAYLNNPYAIGRQLCQSYCAQNPSRSGCQNYRQSNATSSPVPGTGPANPYSSDPDAPIVVMKGASGRPQTTFKNDEPIEVVATIANSSGDVKIKACAEIAGGHDCLDAVDRFPDVRQHSFTCNYNSGRFSCYGRQATNADLGNFTGGVDSYFLNPRTGAVTKVSYTVVP